VLHNLAKHETRKLPVFTQTLYVALPTSTENSKTHSNYHLVTAALVAFSTLTLLVGRQERHPPVKMGDGGGGHYG